MIIYTGKSNTRNITIRICKDKSSKTPYSVSYRITDGGFFQELLKVDNLKDAYAYYNQLLV